MFVDYGWTNVERRMNGARCIRKSSVAVRVHALCGGFLPPVMVRRIVTFHRIPSHPVWTLNYSTICVHCYFFRAYMHVPVPGILFQPATSAAVTKPAASNRQTQFMSPCFGMQAVTVTAASGSMYHRIVYFNFRSSSLLLFCALFHRPLFKLDCRMKAAQHVPGIEWTNTRAWAAEFIIAPEEYSRNSTLNQIPG